MVLSSTLTTSSPSKLDSTCREGGWHIKVVTQPEQSPDLNVKELGFFGSLKSWVWKEGYRSIQERVEGIGAMFAEYDNETLVRVWQSLYEMYNRALRARGGNDFKVKRTGIAQRPKREELATAIKIDRTFQHDTSLVGKRGGRK